MVFIRFSGFGGSFEAHIYFRPSCSVHLNTAKIYLSNKSKSNADRQKKNKNHFTPISEQACALNRTEKLINGYDSMKVGKGDKSA